MVVATPTSSGGLRYPVVDGYRLVQAIGGGGFSKVFKAVNKGATEKPRVIAVKVVSYAKPSLRSLQQRHPPDPKALRKEIAIHTILKHINVLEFLGACEFGLDLSTPEGKRQAAMYVPGIYMMLELAEGGDLFDKIPPDEGLDEDLAHFYFTQLIEGLTYVHEQGVVHRDVKPENLLLDADGNLKLADFGLCAVYRYKGKERDLQGPCGSLPYIAPEMNGNPYRGETVDVWSSGIVLFAMLVGNTPWDEPTRRSPEYAAFLTGELLKHHPWPRIQGPVLDLLLKMIHPDPNQRMLLEHVRSHPWYTRKNSLMEQGKCKDPVGLAERLLQGLIVSGDMDYNLHTDNQRADPSGLISLTQPEWNSSGARLEMSAELPSASAVPRLGNDAARLALSQRVGARRANLPSSTAEAGAGGLKGSQFTQALNHMTQWSALAPGSSRFSPHLTRFFSRAPPAEVARGLMETLESLAIQAHIQAINRPTQQDEDDGDGDDVGQDDGTAAGLLAPADDDGLGSSAEGEDVAMSDAVAAAPAAFRPATVGTAGAQIRIGTTDQRKCVLRGTIHVEALQQDPRRAAAALAAGQPSCLVVMRRSQGDPLEWRRLFRALVRSADVKRDIVKE